MAQRQEIGSDQAAARRCIRVDDWQDFALWIPAWERLLDAAAEASLFHEPAWLGQAWHYPGGPLLAALLCRGDELDAGLILCPRWETGFNVLLPVRALQCLPHLPLLDPCVAVVAKRPGVSIQDAAHLIEVGIAGVAWDILLFGHLVPRIQWLEEAAKEVARRRGWMIEYGTEAQEAIIDLSAGVEAYWANRSKELARRIRVGRKRLHESGHFMLLDAVSEGMEWAECWSQIERVFADTWQQKGELSPFQSRWRKQTQAAMASLFASGRLFPFFASLDGEPIAFEVWLGGRDELYGIARGMSQRFGKLSLGNVLAAYVIERTAAHGFRRQWLGTLNDLPHFAYKRRWLTELEGGRQLILIRPRSWYGRIYRLLTGSRVAAWLFELLQIKRYAIALFARAQALKWRYSR